MECCHPHAPSAVRRLWRQRELLAAIACGLLALAGAFGPGELGIAPAAAQVCFLAAYALGGVEPAVNAARTLARGAWDVDLLMVLAALGAAVLGEWAEGATLLFLFSLGHSLEHMALDRARRGIDALRELRPAMTRVRRREVVVDVPVEAVAVGDVVLVGPGERIPVDGIVTVGTSAVDQGAVTGESLPIECGVGDTVLGGTLNGDGALEVTTRRTAGESTLGRVMRMVEEAVAHKSRAQRFADRVTGWFVPTVLAGSLAVALLPPSLGILSWSEAGYRAILLLVAGSPCALAISAPATVLAGVSQGARHGVLIKGGARLEALGQVRAVAFDKTGTLTEGRPRVVSVTSVDGEVEMEWLPLAAAIESGSRHPLAQGVVNYAALHCGPLPPPLDVRTTPGRGIEGTVSGQRVRVGSRRYFANEEERLPNALLDRLAIAEQLGHAVLLVNVGARWVGAMQLSDAVRNEAIDILAELRTLGIGEFALLTGDHAQAAERVAAVLGIEYVRAELLPGDKLECVSDLVRRFGPTAMVGDGINDAPALARATVGIAMGAAGSDAALESGDVALMSHGLRQLPFAFRLGRAALRIAQQNVLIALATVAVLAPVALLGWTHLGWTVVIHEGSTVLVALNALRLLVVHPNRNRTT